MNFKPLEKIGLTEKDVQIYIELLKKQELTATEIAKNTGLNRSHVYDKLDRLIEKGIVSYIIKNNKKYFKSTKPERLKEYILDIQKEIFEIIPQLNKLKKQKNKTNVEIFQGKEGMKSVFKDILKEKHDYFVLGEEGKFQEILPIYIEQFLRDVKHYKIKEHLLSKESLRKKIKKASQLTKIKYLPDNYFSPVMMAIYKNKIAIFIWSEPLITILIESKQVQIGFKNYFNLLWKIAKK
jgi:sugar-specific transcriptional regulator TrmB